MDIYAYGESINWMADYMDMHTGLIYGLVDYHKHPENYPDGIPVYEDGMLIGYAKKKEA